MAILDTINPGGHYTKRIQRLGRYSLAAPRAARPPPRSADIADPLYGSLGEGDAVALHAAITELTHACEGLVEYLSLLQQR